jgi:hypothetical protein
MSKALLDRHGYTEFILNEEECRRIGRARYDASLCGRCGTAIAPGEPVWRAHCWVELAAEMAMEEDGHPNTGRYLAPTCSACAPPTLYPDLYPNYAARPCEGCGRAVYENPGSWYRPRRIPSRAYCCIRCRWAAQARRRSERRAERRSHRRCRSCGEPFQPGHLWARYCSAACRQRAYRQRQQDAPGAR